MKRRLHCTSPPWLAVKLLRAFLDEVTSWGLLGDLEEESREIYLRHNRFFARCWYWLRTAEIVLPAIKVAISWRFFMFIHILRFMGRRMRRQKGFSSLNLFGLALGLACCMLIITFVQHELSYDRHHQNFDRIYRVGTDLDFGGGSSGPLAISNYPIGTTLKERYPVVEAAARLRRAFHSVMVTSDEHEFMEEYGFFADNDVFKVFTIPLQYGDPETALSGTGMVAISRSMADKYFGDTDALNQVLTIDNSEEYIVTAVFEDVPNTSHVHFDMLFSFETLLQAMPEQTSRWVGDFGNYSYLLLQTGIDPADIEAEIPGLVQEHLADLLKAVNGRIDMFLTPLADIHLRAQLTAEIGTQGRIEYVYLFSVIAAFILILACINYMNLSTARATRRLKEIGLRKVMGSSRHALMKQILAESLGFSLLATLIALVIVPLSLPLFQQLAGRTLIFSPFTGFMPLIIIAIVGTSGILAGIYPSLVISRWTPVQLFHGISGRRSRNYFRDTLVILQFTVSIALMIAAGLVGQQLHYLRNTELGFDKEQVIILPIQGRLNDDLAAVKAELISYPGIISTGATSQIPGGGTRRNAFLPEGFELSQNNMMAAISVEPDYLTTMGLQLLEGETFRYDRGGRSTEYIINETAMNQIGWDKAVAKSLRELDGQGNENRIIGVIKDYHFESLHNVILPLVLEYNPDHFSNLAIRIQGGQVRNVIEYLEAMWPDIAPEDPFTYSFLDDRINQMYGDEARMSSIFKFFTGLAMLIAVLGLLGLAAYAAEQRIKEIGIRKVLGASVGRLIIMMSKDAVLWSVIANVLAWPLAWYGMGRWLEEFPYRAPISSTVFILSGLGALAIALLTVVTQVMKAAQANPASILRSE